MYIIGNVKCRCQLVIYVDNFLYVSVVSLIFLKIYRFLIITKIVIKIECNEHF